jgi:hypothetical protein
VAAVLDTYSHLWPDSVDRTRAAVDAVLLADSMRTSGWSPDVLAGHRYAVDELACKPDTVHGFEPDLRIHRRTGPDLHIRPLGTVGYW